ncbi:tRNA adenosine(34) deaminase TadA [Bacillus massilinigeriensis]|uniref:tRNA adenosine(34) deaminase TadA n=1 Tax=Bacillus mediterraneensis TaxID=1805474 RepID=UPI0008F97521|nr:tRNA adenosine(34) deaminase TadA [Bacillus mediterraneensis]
MLEDERFMREAIIEAEKARVLGEVPIGAVIVLDGQVISRGHNLRETNQRSTAHAEILAIEEACRKIGSWRLEDTELFVTLEPCPMCAGAIMLSRVKRVVYGASDPKGGCAGTLMDILRDERFNHQSEVVPGVLEERCGRMLSDFFRELREEKKQDRKRQKEQQEKELQ